MERTVLLIEDDPHASRLVKLVLQRHDVHVLIAENGSRGVQLAQAELPKLILLDLLLPDIGGFEVLEQLQEYENTAGIPVFILSASVQNDDQERASAMGVRAYLSKPYRPGELITMVEELLSAE